MGSYEPPCYRAVLWNSHPRTNHSDDGSGMIHARHALTQTSIDLVVGQVVPVSKCIMTSVAGKGLNLIANSMFETKVKRITTILLSGVLLILLRGTDHDVWRIVIWRTPRYVRKEFLNIR